MVRNIQCSCVLCLVSARGNHVALGASAGLRLVLACTYNPTRPVGRDGGDCAFCLYSLPPFKKYWKKGEGETYGSPWILGDWETPPWVAILKSCGWWLLPWCRIP